MFIAHRLKCKDHLKEGKNELVLHFSAPFLEAKKEEAANGGKMPVCKCFSQQPSINGDDAQGMGIRAGCTLEKLSTAGVGIG